MQHINWLFLQIILDNSIAVAELKQEKELKKNFISWNIVLTDKDKTSEKDSKNERGQSVVDGDRVEKRKEKKRERIEQIWKSVNHN